MAAEAFRWDAIFEKRKNFCYVFGKTEHTRVVTNLRRDFRMEKCNECIKCTVEQCRHHHGTKNYCTLDSIQVGTHEMNPTQDQCTDCMSFAVK